MTIALGVGLFVAFIILNVAQRQPRFDLDFTIQGQQVMVSGPPVTATRGASPVRALAVTDGAGQTVALTPTTLTEEPNFLPSFAQIREFMAEQDHIATILRTDPRIVVVNSAGERRTVALAAVEGAHLPFAFWYQLFVGFVIYAISVWLWAIAPGNRPNLFFALSGIGMLMSAGAAAIYSSRELAIGAPLFRILGIFNEIGASLFGMAMINLFLVYPRRIAGPRFAAALTMVLLTWTIAAAARMVPDPNFGNNGTTLVEMGVIVIAVIAQLFATRGDPVGRSALRWLGIGTVIGAGAFLGTATLPLLLGRPVVVDQGMAFGFFLIIIAGIAMGLRRDRLFAVDQLSFSVLYYSAIAISFFLVDVALLYALGSQRLAGVMTGVVLLPLLYLPIRDRAIEWVSGTRKPDTLRILEDVMRMNFARAEQDRVKLWRESLDHAFRPLAIENSDENGEETGTVRLEHDGTAMAIPAVSGAPPLRLRLARRGRSLFRQADSALAQRMVAMAMHADAERTAFERGVVEERARVARDLHDDLAARLMDGLAHDRVDSLRETIRHALVEVRSIVNGRASAPMLVADALADARAEAAERLEVAGIALNWPLVAPQGRLAPSQARALESSIREAITNIVRHSGATLARVDVDVGDGILTMAISDNGTALGPDTSGEAEAPTGNGLRNVQYRIGSAGGDARFHSGEEGFRVSLRLPVGDGE